MLSPSRDWFRLGLILQVAVGALIIGAGIGSAPLWFDELASLSVAERSPGGIFEVLGNTDANMGFYYLILHAWLWAGDSEAWIRTLSAIPAVANIPLTSILARRLFDETTGLVAGFLLAGSMFMVANAQNARAYALALFLITLATLFFVEAVRSRRPVHFFAYGASSALAVYASPLAGLVLVAHLASLPFLPLARALLRPFALTYTLVLIGLAPLVALMAAVGGGQVSFLERPGVSEALDAAAEMLAMGNAPLVAAWVALIAIGLAALWRVGWWSAEQQDENLRWRRSLVVGWAALPPVLLFAFSQLDPLFAARYLLTSTPALAIIAAIGAVAIVRHSRALAVAGAGVMICFTLLARFDLESYGDTYRQGWGPGDLSAARLIASRAEAGDGIVYYPWGQRLAIDMHLKREAAPGAVLPDDFAVAAGAEQLGDLYAQQVQPETLISRLKRHPRVWLLRWDSREGGLTRGVGLSVLRSGYSRLLARDYGVLRIELYERKRDLPTGLRSPGEGSS